MDISLTEYIYFALQLNKLLHLFHPPIKNKYCIYFTLQLTTSLQAFLEI